MKPTTIAGAAMLVFSTAGASAQFSPVQDHRYLYTGGFFTNLDGTLPGETFDPMYPSESFAAFDETHAMAYLGGTLQCSTNQDSSLSPSVFSASGGASVAFDGPNPNPDGSLGEAASFGTVRVSLDAPAIVRLEATLLFEPHDENAPGELSRVFARVAEPRGLGFVTYFVVSNEEVGNAAGPIGHTIRLDAGEWLLQFAAHVSTVDIAGDPRTESGSYEGTFTYVGEPCSRADLAAPMGVLDLADIMAWVAEFTGSGVVANPTVDFNGDEVFDLADVQGFVGAFVAGCG